MIGYTEASNQFDRQAGASGEESTYITPKFDIAKKYADDFICLLDENVGLVSQTNSLEGSTRVRVILELETYQFLRLTSD